MVERLRTCVRRPDAGDVLIDPTYTDYAVFGNVAFPTRIRQLQNGRPVLDVTVTAVEPNAVHIAAPGTCLRRRSHRSAFETWTVPSAAWRAVSSTLDLSPCSTLG
jgi:hypothetical protein